MTNSEARTPSGVTHGMLKRMAATLVVSLAAIGEAAADVPSPSHAGHKSSGTIAGTRRNSASSTLAFVGGPGASLGLRRGQASAFSSHGASVCTTKHGLAPRKMGIEISDEEDEAEISTAFGGRAQLVTYGEIFRSALSDVEQRELREEEARRIDVVTPVARAASSVGSGVVSVLERIFSNGSKDEEISKNLSQFAMRHPGAVALPSQSKRSKTDLDRLEDALDFDLETATGDAEVMKLDKDDML